MGFRYRARTKGKNAWINFSKKGVSSFSVKLFDNVTLNIKDGKVKSTTRLAKGLSYVSESKNTKQPKPSTPSKVKLGEPNRTNTPNKVNTSPGFFSKAERKEFNTKMEKTMKWNSIEDKIVSTLMCIWAGFWALIMIGVAWTIINVLIKIFS